MQVLLDEMHALRMKGAALFEQQQHARHAVLTATHQQRAMISDAQLSQRSAQHRVRHGYAEGLERVWMKCE